MSPTREPSSLQRDLREETWIAPDRTVVAWPSRFRRPAPKPAPSRAIAAECTCPSGCVRDHETD
jgi:hypothetical protein